MHILDWKFHGVQYFHNQVRHKLLNIAVIMTKLKITNGDGFLDSIYYTNRRGDDVGRVRDGAFASDPTGLELEAFCVEADVQRKNITELWKRNGLL